MRPRGVALKLDRADAHRRDLDAAIDAYLATEPYSARVVVESGGEEFVLYWDRYEMPPPEFGLIAGDAIHNFRSSLDHLVVALAESGAARAGVTLTDRQLGGLQFPLTSTPEGFADQLIRGRLLHVDTQARDYIESRQPFRADRRYVRRLPLVELIDLDNTDKHRALTIAALTPVVVKVNWPEELNGVQLSHGETATNAAPFAEMGRFVFPSPRSLEELPIEFRWGFGLAYKGMVFFETIQHTLDTYAKVVGFLADYLSNFAA